MSSLELFQEAAHIIEEITAVRPDLFGLGSGSYVDLDGNFGAINQIFLPENQHGNLFVAVEDKPGYPILVVRFEVDGDKDAIREYFAEEIAFCEKQGWPVEITGRLVEHLRSYGDVVARAVRELLPVAEEMAAVYGYSVDQRILVSGPQERKPSNHGFEVPMGGSGYVRVFADSTFNFGGTSTPEQKFEAAQWLEARGFSLRK